MYYTKEELLEAVDILVEDYGIDEDEAIELVLQESNILSEVRLTPRTVDDLDRRQAANLNVAVATGGDQEEALNTYNRKRERLLTNAERQGIVYDDKKGKYRYKKVMDAENKVRDYLDDEENRKKATIAAGGAALAVGGALAYRKLKKRRQRKLREDYELFCNDEEELLEAIDILVEECGFDEDYAIDLIVESYEEDILSEYMGNPMKLKDSARNLATSYVAYDKMKSKKTENQLRGQGYDDELIKNTQDAYKGQLKKDATQFAKDAAVPVAGVAATALLARKAIKKARRRR